MIQEIILDIEDDNYKDFINQEFAVLNFFSDWHMNCLMCLPMIEDVAHDFLNNVCFGKLNVDEMEHIAKRHNVSCVPTLVFFRNGQQIERIDGSINEDILREKINILLQIC